MNASQSLKANTRIIFGYNCDLVLVLALNLLGKGLYQATHHLNHLDRLNAVWIAFEKEKGESCNIRPT